MNKGNELAQAKYLVSTCKGKVGSYFVGYILDVEAGNDASNVKQALDYLVSLGGKTMIYTGYADYSKYKSVIDARPSNCAWWESRYGLNNGSYSSKYPCHNGVDLHQYTSQGSCPGITVNCDLNRLTGTKQESWFKTKQIEQNVASSDPDGVLKENTGVMQSNKDALGELSYRGYFRGCGWLAWLSDGAMIGSTGQNRRMEALQIVPVGQMDVTVHMKDIGDKTYKDITKDTVIGTMEQSRRIEALKIESADTVYLYRVHQKDLGWSEWCVNGQWAGKKGQGKQVEAVEIKVADIAYKAGQQNNGESIWYADGMTAGETGKSLMLNYLMLKSQHCGEVSAKAHIQDIGWVDYGVINQNTVIGTKENKRLECLCFKGDFKWRAHIQGTGWTAWTDADGVATLGTIGQSLRIEAIEFVKS